MLKILLNSLLAIQFRRFLSLTLIFGLTCLLCSALDSGQTETPPLHNVGYQVIDIPYNSEDHDTTLTAAVWYPTEETPDSYTYGGPTKGMVAVNAAPLSSSETFPVLFFSHGYSSSGIGSVFFTEALAAHGWIVIAPDHHDDYSAIRIKTGEQNRSNFLKIWTSAQKIGKSTPEDRNQYIYRLDEMTQTMDVILNHTDFSQIADMERIAICGHSFGGFAALGFCGTLPKYYDPRIKAVLLFSSGAAGYLYTEEELRNIQIPSMHFWGEREMQQKRGTQTMAALSAKIFNNLPSPKYLLEIENGNHFSYNNCFSNRLLSKILSGDEKEFEVICRYSIAFLEKYVAGKPDSKHTLEKKDPMLTHIIAD